MKPIASLLLTGSLLILSACGLLVELQSGGHTGSYAQDYDESWEYRQDGRSGTYNDHRDRNRRDRHGSRRRSRYVVGAHEVFYDGRLVKDASASSFEVLGDGYAKDRWTVYFEGVPVKNASASSFRVLKDGYAADTWHAYYDGRPIAGASGKNFRVLRDGYAKDNWCVYWAGKRVEDANPGSFEALRDGYGKDAWSTFRYGRKIGR